MKSLEEISELSLDELEQMADQSTMSAPEGLKERLSQQTMLMDFLSQNDSHPIVGHRRVGAFVRWSAAACLVLLICVGTGLSLSARPKDTFSDPALAYAQVEEAFSLISSKMEKGVEMMEELEPAIETTNRLINKLY